MAAQTIPQLEAQVLAFWKKAKIFEKSVEQNPAADSYVFYDGPPFISGLPHYGHLLGSIAKDVIPRYWTMRGKRVERVWGWDAHGLTVENKVQKELGIKNRRDIEQFGLEKFTEECYKYTSQISAEWEWYVDKIGRWVDFTNAYRTTDQPYMESVIWAFKQLYDRGLIYEGVYTSLYCTRCGTPVSHFEVAMDNSYKDTEDPAITVAFKVLRAGTFKDCSLLAWTTTPWTIPSNRALVVDPQEDYVVFVGQTPGTKYICAAKRLEALVGTSGYTVVNKFKGKDLIGLSYAPPYTFFASSDQEFKVYPFEGMVNMAEGTGIVHSAPGFGEIDTKMGRHCGLRVMLTLDAEGKLLQGDAGENPFAGLFYAAANSAIVADLEQMGYLFNSGKVVHRVPFHDRCNTVLIQRAQNSWFVNVSKLKPELLQNNETITWVPQHIKEGRFKLGLEQAPDWCISRDRFWATPMPVWESADGERVVLGSITELEELSGTKVENLHRPYIDRVVFTKNGKVFKRRPEVLDSWMEAGSMPFAQIHYPFEHKAKFEQNFPGDYIAEYVAQTRAWFFFMHTLSTALFGKASFKHVVCTGVMAGTDGRKMSKTFGNYTDPKQVLTSYGGDAVRLYLMGSPLMVGENANFDELDLKNKLQRTLTPLWNCFKYLETYARAAGWTVAHRQADEAVLNVWIRARLAQTIESISKNLASYTVPPAVRAIESCVDDLSRWYVRRSRDKIASGDSAALTTLYDVLVQLAEAAAPIIPFLSESMYLGLKEFDPGLVEESVHLRRFPQDIAVGDSSGLGKMLQDMDLARRVASLGLSLRSTKSDLGVRQVLAKAVVAGVQLDDAYAELIKSELNVKELEWVHELPAMEDAAVGTDRELAMGLVLTLTPELQAEGNARELVRQIQDLRKAQGLSVTQKVAVTYPATPENIAAVAKLGEELKHKVGATKLTPGSTLTIN